MRFPPIATPKTLEEALELRIQASGKQIPFMGGTDVLVHLRNNRMTCDELLNLSQVRELSFISASDDFIEIGAGTTHSDILDSEIVYRHCHLLQQAVRRIGSAQVRNRGTIGGNICNASPAGDSIPPLYVREAILVIQSTENSRTIPIIRFLTGPGFTDLQRNELVTSVRIPKRSPTVGTYQSLRQRKALACNKVSVAMEALATDGGPIDFRIACGAVSPTVVRASEAEKLLNEGIQDENLVSKAAMRAVEPIDDVRSNAEYRRAMTGVLVAKAMRELLS
jgi:xanthine dehydrogenase FAD-binding subunit